MLAELGKSLYNIHMLPPGMYKLVTMLPCLLPISAPIALTLYSLIYMLPMLMLRNPLVKASLRSNTVARILAVLDRRSMLPVQVGNVIVTNSEAAAIATQALAKAAAQASPEELVKAGTAAGLVPKLPAQPAGPTPAADLSVLPPGGAAANVFIPPGGAGGDAGATAPGGAAVQTGRPVTTPPLPTSGGEQPQATPSSKQQSNAPRLGATEFINSLINS